MKPTGGQACGRARSGGAGVLVAHMALAGMLDLSYLKVRQTTWSMIILFNLLIQCTIKLLGLLTYFPLDLSFIFFKYV